MAQMTNTYDLGHQHGRRVPSTPADPAQAESDADAILGTARHPDRAAYIRGHMAGQESRPVVYNARGDAVEQVD